MRAYAHDDAPDKDPARRLQVIEEAGRQGIPFTTGILIGIGETMQERVENWVPSVMMTVILWYSG